jgi:hypothetical protein
MSHISGVVLGLLVAAATFGAVQLASGSDLGTGGVATVSVTVSQGVNRTAKSDRAGLPVPGAAGQTLSFQTDTVAGTSVLLRLPATPIETIIAPPKPPARDISSRRSPVACEPVVSVLTEVAKRLQPGRCVT